MLSQCTLCFSSFFYRLYVQMNHENYLKIRFLYFFMIYGVRFYLVSDPIVEETRNRIKYEVYLSLLFGIRAHFIEFIAQYNT